jgi:hypothetical protein
MGIRCLECGWEGALDDRVPASMAWVKAHQVDADHFLSNSLNCPDCGSSVWQLTGVDAEDPPGWADAVEADEAARLTAGAPRSSLADVAGVLDPDAVFAELSVDSDPDALDDQPLPDNVSPIIRAAGRELELGEFVLPQDDGSVVRFDTSEVSEVVYDPDHAANDPMKYSFSELAGLSLADREAVLVKLEALLGGAEAEAARADLLLGQPTDWWRWGDRPEVEQDSYQGALSDMPAEDLPTGVAANDPQVDSLELDQEIEGFAETRPMVFADLAGLVMVGATAEILDSPRYCCTGCGTWFTQMQLDDFGMAITALGWTCAECGTVNDVADVELSADPGFDVDAAEDGELPVDEVDEIPDEMRNAMVECLDCSREQPFSLLVESGGCIRCGSGEYQLAV